jgi:hypothetical protein
MFATTDVFNRSVSVAYTPQQIQSQRQYHHRVSSRTTRTVGHDLKKTGGRPCVIGSNGLRDPFYATFPTAWIGVRA